MQKPALAVVVVTIIAAIAGILIVPQFFTDDQAPTGHWSTGDEIELATEAATSETGEAKPASLDRTAVDLSGTADTAAEDRVEVLLQGRVIDKYKAPIAGANVWLDFGRGGPRGGNNRQRRVPDPVPTDKDGRFAFQGQAFRNLRVSLQVAHSNFAPGLFDKDIGAVTTSVDLGDLTLATGGQIRGRVTDLDGNALPDAELHLQPQNGNSMRFLRDRDRLLPVITTDRNGNYLVAHANAGDWSLTATATHHQEGRSATFAVEEDQAVDVPDIRLGPGYEVTGYVRDVQGQPIAKADVSMRNEDRNRPGGDPNGGPNNGPGGRGFGFGGRDYTTTTDEKGRFFLDHLPGASMNLTVTATGYLEFTEDGIDSKLGQPLQITLQDGLKITAEVKDLDGTPVTMFAYRAVRLRALAPPGQVTLDPQEIFTRLQAGNLDDATAAQLRQQAQSLRGQFGGRGGRGQQGPGRPNGAPSDLGRPELHPDGTLTATGLEEGVYELHVQSPEHARYRSPEVEVRAGAPTPMLQVALDAGVFVAGVVVDDKEQPIRGAHVELRTPSAWNGRGRGRQNAGRQDPNAPAGAAAPVDAAAAGQAMADMARQFMRQAAGAQISLEATTNGEGVFIIKHAPRGNYQLAADARGYANASNEAFDLQSDRSGFELKLGSLGSLEGVVRGVQESEIADTHVAAVPAAGAGGGPGMWFGGGRGGNGGGGPFQTATINADGSYRLADLVPGDYIVRSWVGATQDLMRELMPQFMAGSLAADASVRGGEVTHLDLQLTRPQQGTVAGSVMHNGTAATGYQVDLVQQDDGNTPNPGANMMRGGGPGGRRGFGSLQSTIAASGHFSIEKVPAGSYRLRVQSSRRGDTIYQETIQVLADNTVERDLVLTTYSLKGTATVDEGGKVEDLDGRVSLLLGVATMPENLNEVQGQVLNFNTRLQNGKFEFESVQPGNYLLVLSVRGRERTSVSVVIAGDQTITVAAGKTAAEPAAGAAGNGGRGPGAANGGPGGGRQRGGAGGQGGGRQGGGRQGGRTGQPNNGTPPGGG